MKFYNENYFLYKNPLAFIHQNNNLLYAKFNVPYYNDSDEVNYSTYSVYPLSSFPIDEDLLIWDFFGDNNLFAHPEKIRIFHKSNDLFHLLYIDYLNGNFPLTDHFLEHGTKVVIDIPPVSPFEDPHSIEFIRHKTTTHDGWSFNYGHIFCPSIEQITNNVEYDPLGKIPFPKNDTKYLSSLFADINSSTLEDIKNSFFKLTEKDSNIFIKKVQKNIKDSIFTAGPSGPMKDIFKTDLNGANGPSGLTVQSFSQELLENQSKDQKYNIKESDMSTFSMCNHITVNTSIVKITSKEYSFANVPENVAICTNKNLKKDDRITYCGFGIGPNQTSCSYYSPSYKVLKTYTTEGSDSLSFYLSEQIDYNGKKVYNIINSKTEQISYSFSPEPNVSLDQIIQETDSIVNETLLSFSEEVSSTLQQKLIDAPQELVKEKKSFILSLVS